LEVREAAQSAFAQVTRAGLSCVGTLDYEVRLCIADLSEFRSRIVSVDPERAEIFDAREAELAESVPHAVGGAVDPGYFEIPGAGPVLGKRLGDAGERPGERCFLQPMRADVLRPGAT
jgi:hypothetical protein